MNRQYKVIVFDKINVEFDQEEGADQYSNRMLKWRVRKFGQANTYSECKFEAALKEKKLDWDEKVELVFDNSEKYQIQVLEYEDIDDQYPITILKGIVYLYPSKQFTQNSCHLFTLCKSKFRIEGQKKGLIRLRIKLAIKVQENIKIKDHEKQNQPLIPQNLLGIMRIYEVKARMLSFSLNKAKYNRLSMTLKFQGKQWIVQCSEGNIFTFSSNISDQAINDDSIPLNLESIFPFEGITLSHITENPSANIAFEISGEDHITLTGTLTCNYLSQMRRYPTQTVSLLNEKGVKVADLSVQMRYITKDQLISLIYSPKNNPDFNKRSTTQLQKSTTKVTAISKTNLLKPHSFGQLSLKKPYKLAQSLRYQNRSYSKTSQIQKKSMNPNISYLDPQKWSDFSIKRQRGWDMSLGRKSDFTRPFKGNPGVGSYQLPSLFRHK